MIRVALKDTLSGKFVLNQEHDSGESAWETALQDAEEFFDQNFQSFRDGSPRDFLLYFMSSSQPPMAAKVTLSLQESPQESPAGETAAYARMLKFELQVDMPTPVELGEFPALQ